MTLARLFTPQCDAIQLRKMHVDIAMSHRELRGSHSNRKSKENGHRSDQGREYGVPGVSTSHFDGGVPTEGGRERGWETKRTISMVESAGKCAMK